MTLPLTDAVRVRVIRALLGMDSRTFAQRVGVSAGTLTSWEKSRATPQAQFRPKLAQICHEEGLAFLPSGMPVPAKDCLLFKEDTHA